MLAFGCLTAAVRLCPKIFLITLFADDDDSADPVTPVIRDVASYADGGDDDEVDPQLVGCVATLLGTVMRGSLVESAGDLGLWFNGRRIDHLDIAEKFKDMLSSSDSAVTLKLVLSAAGLFLDRLCVSPMARIAVPVLHALPRAAAESKYWLVKTEFCDIVAALPFVAIHHVTGSSDIQVPACLHVLISMRRFNMIFFPSDLPDAM